MPNKESFIHSGHRLRLKKRYLDEGLEFFSEHQVLELLLYYALPRTDTNVLAHGLIDHYGSLAAVLEADYEDLRRQNGLGDHAALLLNLLPYLWRYYQLSRDNRQIKIIHDHKELAAFAVALFTRQDKEAFYLICLDAQNKVLRIVKMNEGGLDSVHIKARTVAEAALRYKAKSVVLAHNHPAGSLKPSAGDIETTNLLIALLNALDIGVQDHIIVANGKYFSFVEKGILL
ncbi:MAG: hypothetical protein FWG61_04080 [Firmicutes bacterium]|nr:hypothetical protein [Bacillota bacterium]